MISFSTQLLLAHGCQLRPCLPGLLRCASLAGSDHARSWQVWADSLQRENPVGAYFTSTLWAIVVKSIGVFTCLNLIIPVSTCRAGTGYFITFYGGSLAFSHQIEKEKLIKKKKKSSVTASEQPRVGPASVPVPGEFCCS